MRVFLLKCCVHDLVDVAVDKVDNQCEGTKGGQEKAQKEGYVRETVGRESGDNEIIKNLLC